MYEWVKELPCFYFVYVFMRSLNGFPKKRNIWIKSELMFNFQTGNDPK